MVAPTNTERLGLNFRGKAWNDGTPITRVAMVDGTNAEAQASLAYGWNGSIWVAIPGDAVNGLKVQASVAAPAAASAVFNGGKSVAVTHTAVQLPSTSTLVNGAVITANANNVGNVYVGGASVTDDRNTATSGAELQPGQSIGVGIDNLNRMYVNGASGDGVNWLAS